VGLALSIVRASRGDSPDRDTASSALPYPGLRWQALTMCLHF